MQLIIDYFDRATENEEVFRNILKDLRHNRVIRPQGVYVPEDLESEATLDDIFNKYSEGRFMGRFTIVDFARPTRDSATIEFENVALLSGGRAELEYLIKDDNSIEYKKPVSITRY